MYKEQVSPEVMQIQREPDLRGSQWIQRESDFRGSLPSDPDRRETSSKTVKRVSWVDMARQASRSRVSSGMGSCQTGGFSLVIENATSQEDWRA
jgi:hypothetical protein